MTALALERRGLGRITPKKLSRFFVINDDGRAALDAATRPRRAANAARCGALLGVTVDRCPDCGEPAHASETDDAGRCKGCRWRRVLASGRDAVPIGALVCRGGCGAWVTGLLPANTFGTWTCAACTEKARAAVATSRGEGGAK
jgi:DNA-directed RNA polymerase subunit RPC12/RpoP